MLARFYHRYDQATREALIDLTESPATKQAASIKGRNDIKVSDSFLGRLFRSKDTTTSPLITILITLIPGVAACTAITQRQEARPLVLRDVPAQRLAYRFEPDIAIPAEVTSEDANDKIEAIQLDFSTRRQTMRSFAPCVHLMVNELWCFMEPAMSQARHFTSIFIRRMASFET